MLVRRVVRFASVTSPPQSSLDLVGSRVPLITSQVAASAHARGSVSRGVGLGAELLEDVYDILAIELRKNEESVSWEEAKKSLQQQENK